MRNGVTENKRGRLILGIVICAICWLAISPLAAPNNQPENKPVTPQAQLEIIDSVSQALNRAYIFADVAKKMEKFLRKQYKDKKYKDITGLREFADTLTENLQSISHDKHLVVIYMTDELLASIQNDTLTNEGQKRELEEAQRNNFGFQEIKLLEGNVGYINLTRFADTENAGLTAISAMNFLAYADAIIFDLRQNGGGSPSMIQLILSYFFDESTHLNDIYFRQSDSTEQYWTQTYVDGPKMTGADIYVLTSKYTFSGAEEFSYDIKNLKRGMIIGEVTGGGAHLNKRKPFVNLHVGMSLPYGRAINPISGANWEGVGVIPDIEVPADKALDTAYLEALKKLKGKATDEDQLQLVNWAIEGKTTILNPVELTLEQMQKYVGVFGPRTISLENGSLYYQREDRPKYRLIPMGDNKFMLDGLDSFRLQFVADDNGEFNEVIGLYNSGRTDGNERTK